MLDLLLGCAPDSALATLEPGEESPGGATTVARADAFAYSQPAANLSSEHGSTFFTGEALFEVEWLPVGAGATTRDGLGPLFNAVSCEGCHFQRGRGFPPEEGQPPVSLLLRLSVPGADPHGAPLPEPTYGDQLQTRGVGMSGEATVTLTTVILAGTFPDGARFTLLAPQYALTDLRHGPLAPGALLSPRVAQPMIGLGLLAAIPEDALRALTDPDDADHDGISGRLNHVWSPRAGATVTGRFGWKANQPDLEAQSAGAASGDLGLTSSLHPREGCTAAQPDCLAGKSGGNPELTEPVLASLTVYSHLLGVPARRAPDAPAVLRGKALFHGAGCARCHHPSFTTGPLPGYPELEHQSIWPYTDLLLHDLGDALADGRPDFEASGSEWRTPPLWGLGLSRAVGGHTRLLHDGRARSVLEAILWHGGEASAARDAFRALSAAERSALLAFVESL